jgi:ribosomal protein L14E/L6E/L27E
MEKNFKELEKMRIDAMYGKKKHFNAADRKEKLYYRLKIPIIILDVIVGSSFLYLIIQANTFMGYIPSFIGLIVSVLSSLIVFLNLPKTIEGQRKIANRYLAIMKKCDRVKIYISEKFISKNQIYDKLEEIAHETDIINKDAEQYSTNAKDYQRAKDGVISGEEDYTEKEKSTT